MSAKKTILYLSIILIISLSSQTIAKSVYAIIDHGFRLEGGVPAKIAAYGIDGDQINQQFVYELDQQQYPTGMGAGPVGMAISNSGYLFVTHESEYGHPIQGIQVIEAKTMEDYGWVDVTEATNLVGVVFDEDKQKLYTMDRQTNKLFVYLWDAQNKELTLEGDTEILANISSYPNGAYGIALDRDSNELYVTDYSSTVRYYDTNDWSYKGSVDVNRIAVDINIDCENGYLYSGGYTAHNYLIKLDLNDPNAEPNEMNIEAGVIGIVEIC